MLNKLLKDNKANFYLTFRIIVGLLFFLHGASKFGLLGGSGVELVSLMGLAGIVEFFGGLAIVLGAYTEIAAVAGSLVMIGAIVTVHLSKIDSIASIIGASGAEKPLLFLAAFLVIATMGPGNKWVLRK